MQIAEELNDYAEKISKRDVNLLLMKPKKSFATRFLGVHPLSAQLIEKNFLQHGAKLFTFDAYDPDLTITRLKDILK